MGTNKYLFGEIPVEYFQPPLFEQHAYEGKAYELARQTTNQLPITFDDKIRVCRGFVNNAIYSFFKSAGYDVSQTKIVGETQRLVEYEYVRRLQELGIKNVKPFSGPRRFFALLRWVHGDMQNRERYVKTGWKSWSKWKNYKFREL